MQDVHSHMRSAASLLLACLVQENAQEYSISNLFTAIREYEHALSDESLVWSSTTQNSLAKYIDGESGLLHLDPFLLRPWALWEYVCYMCEEFAARRGGQTIIIGFAMATSLSYKPNSPASAANVYQSFDSRASQTNSLCEPLRHFTHKTCRGLIIEKHVWGHIHLSNQMRHSSTDWVFLQETQSRCILMACAIAQNANSWATDQIISHLAPHLLELTSAVSHFQILAARLLQSSLQTDQSNLWLTAYGTVSVLIGRSAFNQANWNLDWSKAQRICHRHVM